MNVHCVEILSILTNTETGDENKKPVMKTRNRRLTQKPVMKTRNRSFSNAYLDTFFHDTPPYFNLNKLLDKHFTTP